MRLTDLPFPSVAYGHGQAADRASGALPVLDLRRRSRHGRPMSNEFFVDGDIHAWPSCTMGGPMRLVLNPGLADHRSADQLTGDRPCIVGNHRLTYSACYPIMTTETLPAVASADRLSEVLHRCGTLEIARSMSSSTARARPSCRALRGCA